MVDLCGQTIELFFWRVEFRFQAVIFKLQPSNFFFFSFKN